MPVPSMRTDRPRRLKDCRYCASEPHTGWIEMPNNGPIVPCPVCNDKSDREREYDRALAQRAANGGSRP